MNKLGTIGDGELFEISRNGTLIELRRRKYFIRQRKYRNTVEFHHPPQSQITPSLLHQLCSFFDSPGDTKIKIRKSPYVIITRFALFYRNYARLLFLHSSE